MAYATVQDIQSRMTRTLSGDEREVAMSLLDDAGVMIDALAPRATIDSKRLVSCRMVSRALGDNDVNIPVGATQGSMSALGYTQSWTIGSGAARELYISKTERHLLGLGNKIGSKSPIEEMVYKCAE